MTDRDSERVSKEPTPGQQWKCGNEFLPFHPQASHVPPAFRDGWNACYRMAENELLMERERCARICESANNYDNPMTAMDCADEIRGGPTVNPLADAQTGARPDSPEGKSGVLSESMVSLLRQAAEALQQWSLPYEQRASLVAALRLKLGESK